MRVDSLIFVLGQVIFVPGTNIRGDPAHIDSKVSIICPRITNISGDPTNIGSRMTIIRPGTKGKGRTQPNNVNGNYVDGVE